MLLCAEQLLDWIDKQWMMGSQKVALMSLRVALLAGQRNLISCNSLKLEPSWWCHFNTDQHFLSSSA